MITEDIIEIENSDNSDEIEASDGTLLDDLMHRAADRGYLTTDDLLIAFPDAEDNMAQLEEIFIQLIIQTFERF